MLKAQYDRGAFSGRLPHPAVRVHLASDETYRVSQIISPNGGLVF
jgi:hypothetical protein